MRWNQGGSSGVMSPSAAGGSEHLWDGGEARDGPLRLSATTGRAVPPARPPRRGHRLPASAPALREWPHRGHLRRRIPAHSPPRSRAGGRARCPRGDGRAQRAVLTAYALSLLQPSPGPRKPRERPLTAAHRPRRPRRLTPRPRRAACAVPDELRAAAAAGLAQGAAGRRAHGAARRNTPPQPRPPALRSRWRRGSPRGDDAPRQRPGGRQAAVATLRDAQPVPWQEGGQRGTASAAGSSVGVPRKAGGFPGEAARCDTHTPPLTLPQRRGTPAASEGRAGFLRH